MQNKNQKMNNPAWQKQENKWDQNKKGNPNKDNAQQPGQKRQNSQNQNS